MDKIKAKIAEWSKDRTLVKVAAGALALILLLLAALCISSGMRSNIHKKYSAAEGFMQDQVYNHLNNMAQLFSRVDDPNVDVRNKLLPALRTEYEAAAALNTVLLDYYGKDSAVLSREQMDAIDAAFEMFAAAYREGSADGLARADMAECMEDIQPLLDAHFTPENPEEDEVLIIDAASGKAINGGE